MQKQNYIGFIWNFQKWPTTFNRIVSKRNTTEETTNTKNQWILIQKFYFRLCVWHSLGCCLSLSVLLQVRENAIRLPFVFIHGLAKRNVSNYFQRQYCTQTQPVSAWRQHNTNNIVFLFQYSDLSCLLRRTNVVFLASILIRLSFDWSNYKNNRWIPSLSKCGNHSIASEKKKMREQTAVWLTGYRNKAKFRTILHWIAFATRRNLMIKVLSSKWNEAIRRTMKSSFGQFLISSWLDGNSNKTNTV